MNAPQVIPQRIDNCEFALKIAFHAVLSLTATPPLMVQLENYSAQSSLSLRGQFFIRFMHCAEVMTSAGLTQVLEESRFKFQFNLMRSNL